jgi:ParB family chromosome partitioning protein
MADYWQPTAASYFAKVSKALILEAVTEGASPEAAANLGALKKDALAERAGKMLCGTGWLPAMLRRA